MHSKFAALLCFVLPTVLASTCPSVNVPLPDPGKCWKCAENKDDFKLSSSTPGRVVDTWTDFYCKYSKRDPMYNPNDPKDRSNLEVICTYNGNGDLIGRAPSAQPCPNKAIAAPAPCEAPKRPPYHQGPYEDCCGTGCKKETEKCFHCPVAPGDWVDVDMTLDGKFECTYHVETDQHDQTHLCAFNSTTGRNIPVFGRHCPPSSVAPQRADCLKDHPEYKVDRPGRTPCPEGSEKEDCLQKQYTQCDYSCMTDQSYCRDVCANDYCFTCPVIKGTTWADGFIRSSQSMQCTYYTDDDVKGASYAGIICLYDHYTGNLDEGPKACPYKADINKKCQRRKPARN